MDREEILYRMHHQKLYCGADPDTMKEQLQYLDLVHDYNQLKPSAQEQKQVLLKKMFAEMGEDCYLETPFYANWGGKNVHIGDRFYSNFNLVLVDDATIRIGNDVMIAPNVVICTATHPVSSKLRAKQAQYNKPVTIHNNVWIGAGSVILPGVTIGENSVIGAGSIVTKDIPANVVAYGNPCRVARPITEQDDRCYDKDQLVDIL